MRIHIFQHAHFENPGNIIDIADEKKYSISYTRFYESFDLPKMDDFDLLIIMGAPMSVHDEIEFPWLKEEKNFIRKAIDIGRKVLGICFGSQLIADVLGAKVYENKYKEIGWFSIQKNLNDKSGFLSLFEDEVLTCHWHGETYDIPNGALPIFSSIATKNQGFIYGNNIVDLQFHWEFKEDNIEDLIQYSKGDLTTGKFVQSTEELLAFPDSFVTNKRLMTAVIEYFDSQ